MSVGTNTVGVKFNIFEVQEFEDQKVRFRYQISNDIGKTLCRSTDV